MYAGGAMASIQRITSALTGEVSYRAQVRVKGRPSQSATFPNRKEAQQWATSLETAIRESRYHPHLRGARTRFAELVARYESSPSFTQLKPSSQASRRAHLRWFVDEWGALTLSEIQPDRVAAARDKLAASTYTRGKPQPDRSGALVDPKTYRRSGATTNRYLATLSHLFSIAVKEWSVAERNPVLSISKPKESRGRTRFLSDDERDALLDACAESQWHPLRALVLLALSTGARRGELVNLKWSDVDLKAGQAVVHETKNGDPRVLPLVGKALEAIRELKLNDSAASPFVFAHPSGLPDPYYGFDGHWYCALRVSGLKNFRFHDLRHSCASYLASQGASLLEIADVLGHRTMAMVKRYSHLASSHKHNVVARMAKQRDL